MKKQFIVLHHRPAISAPKPDSICAIREAIFYISDGVKIIIAVVLGALLLAALTTIFNDTVIPRITQEIEGLFS